MERERIEHEIDQVRSKYGEKILNLLHEERTMYHGDLAMRLSISPSGLNAIIRKMKEAEIPLIQVEQIGKFKKYSLSEAVQAYMDGSDSGEYVSKERQSRERRGLFLPIQRFVEAAGEDWRECLTLLLCGEDEDMSREIQKAFEELIGQLETLYQDSSPELKALQKFMKNEVLLYVLNQYLEKI
ncbi:MAG: hypothetical protein HFH25_03420 [Lachnospiraceae bacterium]|nr:hypothetical protein [Lachnospiraceae bacterium]